MAKPVAERKAQFCKEVNNEAVVCCVAPAAPVEEMKKIVLAKPKAEKIGGGYKSEEMPRPPEPEIDYGDRYGVDNGDTNM